ncbi:aromatic amino acid aminotransferase [Eisenbergiella tayi]|uniref:Aminotransferase n=1 Tax=Eisenbergiella tayi TaxID=1432052 RepID=A0A1E3UEY9_9FIRM|nr:aminotransferase class I/II-fold pyridoxal phosphate-dependent enzyme [Eisenbergiella tayi]ODR47490.1 aromatic amino acid aminotransferase [Eisenbergiella tayi]
MREKLSQKVMNLKSSGIRAFFDMANEIPDVISLGVGEPDFDTPWHIREAGIQALQSGKTFYTSNAGLQELRAAISSYTKRKTGLTYNPENQIIVTVGGSEAIDLALRALLNAGDEVIYLEPGFVSYYPCIKLADGVPVPIRLTEENRFRLKPEQLEAAVTPKSKVLILSYPNNPTGAVMEKEDLEALLPVIQKHDLIVISDEIYGELTYGVKHCSIAGLPGMGERTVIINGFSKSFAMTGWRLGYALGNHEMIEQMVKIHQFAVMCAPTISQYAAIEAMEQGDGDIEAMRESYDQRRKFLYHELQRLGLPCFEPQGAFYMFPNIREFGLSSGEFALKLLKEEKVAVVPGDSFGECGEGFVRISYAASLQNLKEAVNRISRFLSRYRT